MHMGTHIPTSIKCAATRKEANKTVGPQLLLGPNRLSQILMTVISGFVVLEVADAMEVGHASKQVLRLAVPRLVAEAGRAVYCSCTAHIL
jgi:hypothetical protein